MKDNQFVKVAAISPKLVIGKPLENVKYMIEEINKIKDENPHFIVFPELAVSSYTIGDLVFQSYMIERCYDAIHYFLKNNPTNSIVIFGSPVLFQSNLYNGAFVVKGNKVLGIVPKMYLPTSDEYYDRRFFVSGLVLKHQIVKVNAFDAPFGSMLFHEESKDITFGVEICEDMWAPIPPSAYLSVNGAQIVFNLSASNEVLDKDIVRRYITQSISRRNNNAYVYVSSGRYESTQDTVFSNHNLIVENGVILKESELFSHDSSVIIGDIDLGCIKYTRKKNSSLKDSLSYYFTTMESIKFNCKFKEEHQLSYNLSKTPFVPSENIKESFNKILNIQKASLAKRVEYTHVEKLFIGISGGLDSTLAVLVACETFKFLGRDLKDIVAVTMPGFGTSDRTLNNAKTLAQELGITLKVMDIKESVLAHFKTIEHDPNQIDTTYENAQARERTNMLLNLANKHRGLVVGTGDLSELALGWCTFNGDQMSNYSVNGGLPKTLVKFMVKGYADNTSNHDLKVVLYDILDTPISPELTGVNQKTEDIIGKYEVNDFIINRMLMCGDDEARIRYLLKIVFKDDLTDDEIDKYLKTFYQRFFTQQFKRSTLPDGPKVLKISLSPRTDFRMPTDAEY